MTKEDKKEYLKNYYQLNKERLKEKSLQNYHENIEERKKKKREYYQENRDSIIAKVSEYDKNHRTKANARLKKWKKNNPEKVVADTALRRARKMKATPSWLTVEQKDAISAFYDHAHDCKVTSGQQYHVDHIVPLKGKNVCGLHVPWNLQVLPDDVNMKKNNQFEEGNL